MKGILAVSLFLATTPLFCQSAATLNQSPSVSLTNGVLKARVYLPDAKKGFYHSTRFDWSGFIGALEYKGHNYYGDWFSRLDTDLKYWDFNYDGDDILIIRSSLAVTDRSARNALAQVEVAGV